MTAHGPSAVAQLREWALCLAGLGWKVFPLRVGGKLPVLHGYRTCPRTGICAHGHRKPEARATTDPERIQRCWSAGAFNIGVSTGPSGLLVVDCDQPKPGHSWPDGWSRVGVRCGEDVLAVLCEQAGETLPDTYTVTTPSGGKHLYFRAPHDRFHSTVGFLGPLIDTRAGCGEDGGGHVVGAGSITPRGAYELVDDSDPADLPGWLVQALAPKPAQGNSAPREIAAVHLDRYTSAALRNECGRVAAARSGRQNQTLYEAALALGRLVAGGAVDDATVRTRLHETVSRLPLSRPGEPWEPEQIDATIDSAFRTSASRPRRPRTAGGEAA